jgi:hypothetical protein
MRQIKFKGKRLTARKAVSNILAVYAQCTEDDLKDWYGEANRQAQQLAETYDKPLPVVCGIIAALSPLNNWDKNLDDAERLLAKMKVAHTRVFIRKAELIEHLIDTPDLITKVAEVLNGNKITSFYLNILYPKNSNVLTIDRHAISVLLGRNATAREYSLTTKQYEFFQNCFTLAANEVGVAPILMQSATWEAWRRLKNQKTV